MGGGGQSGKSLFLRAILGVVNSEGSVTVNDSDEELQAEKHRIGYVPQNPEVLHETMRFNLTMGRPKISDGRMIKTLKDVNIFEDLVSFFGTEQFLDCEFGMNKSLSGGQKQRLALARAILTRPDILVLDNVL